MSQQWITRHRGITPWGTWCQFVLLSVLKSWIIWLRSHLPDHSIIINKLSVGCLILLHEHKTTITTIKGPYFRVTFFSVEIAALMPQEYREKASTYWLITQQVDSTACREGGSPAVMKTLDSICSSTESVLETECYKLCVGLPTCDSDPKSQDLEKEKQQRAVLLF